MNESNSSTLTKFVDELVDVGAAMSQIVSHMARSQASGRSAPDAPPIPVVLRGLIGGVLEPLEKEHGDAALQAATTILAAANDAIAGEIVLVAPDEAA